MSEPDKDANWSSNWDDDAEDKRRHFQSLSATEKILAVEAMQEAALYFQERARKRKAQDSAITD